MSAPHYFVLPLHPNSTCAGDTSGDEHEWDVHVLRITSPCCSADTEGEAKPITVFCTQDSRPLSYR
jgi:hypothetical protein